MPLNPIVYTEKVVRSFLRYQLTSYALADPGLYDQMREQLRVERLRATPLLRGPYVSLSRGFRQGASIEELIDQGVLHPHMRRIVPDTVTEPYGHLIDGAEAAAITATADMTSAASVLAATGTDGATSPPVGLGPVWVPFGSQPDAKQCVDDARRCEQDGGETAGEEASGPVVFPAKTGLEAGSCEPLRDDARSRPGRIRTRDLGIMSPQL